MIAVQDGHLTKWASAYFQNEITTVKQNLPLLARASSKIPSFHKSTLDFMNKDQFYNLHNLLTIAKSGNARSEVRRGVKDEFGSQIEH